MARTLIGNFKGPKGDKGDQGAVGPVGPEGKQGPVGPAGGVTSVNGGTGDVIIGGVNLNIASLLQPYFQDGSADLKPCNPGNNEKIGDYVAVAPGEVFTVQNWITTPVGANLLKYWVNCVWFDSGKKYLSQSIHQERLPESPSTEEYGNHAVFTVTAPENAAYLRVSARYYNDGKIKLERGTVATDWSPAPEDILTEWGTAKAAEKLAVARSINGVAFDGTGDIDIANLRETRVVDTDFQTYVSDFISNNRNRVDGVDAYRFFVNEPGDPGQYHLPVADSHIFVFGNTVNYTRALAMDVRTRDVYVCGCISGVWRDWVKVLDSTGKAASAGSADKLNHSLTFTGAVSGTFDGSGDVKIDVPTIPDISGKADKSALDAALKRIEALEARLDGGT